MSHTTIWYESDRAMEYFQSAVSLHSHTLHSRESLGFIYHLAAKFETIYVALRLAESTYHKLHGRNLDLDRAWWTPPLAARDAWQLETDHIETLGLNALVSITDHDNIEAPRMLRVLSDCRSTPISVEWTVPFRPTFVHFGVHNLAADRAREIMLELAAYTAQPCETRLGELLEWLTGDLQTLLVFNHPCWDEKGVGNDSHRAVACELLRRYRPYLHALEFNGLRSWRENRSAIELAREFDKPVISGGDRHGLEPNTILNWTNARTFAEFAGEIREGWSKVLVTNQYAEPYLARVLQTIEDVLADHENHGKGWRHWSDRVFYLCDDGVERSFAELWGGHEPLAAKVVGQGINMLRLAGVRHVFRAAFAKREENAL